MAAFSRITTKQNNEETEHPLNHKSFVLKDGGRGEGGVHYFAEDLRQ